MNSALFEFTKNKKVGFFGIGKTNLELLRELMGTEVEITLRSDNVINREVIPPRLKITAIYEKNSSCGNIKEDIIFFSPSVRRDRWQMLSALGRGTIFSSDIEFFLQSNQEPIFLVTGSDGKTTTAHLAEQMLKSDDRDAIAIGNIGRAATPLLEKGNTTFVLEASSFMLEYVAPKSRRAVITSLTPEHLSWHRGYDGYKKAKLRAFEKADTTVISLDSEDLYRLGQSQNNFAVTSTKLSQKEMIRSFDAEYYYCIEGEYITENGRRLINISELRRKEEYNIRNYLSALALTKGYAIEDKALSVIRDFSGIEHRGEIFLERRGVRFINSSIDTSPERTATTLKSVDGSIILMLGGKDKGLPFQPIIDALDHRVKLIILFGEVASKFADLLPNTFKKRVLISLEDATREAMEVAKDGDTVLLSPGAASYDEFSSFEERGEFFKSIVLANF